MFNDNAQDSDRQKMLEELIRQGDDYDEDANEIPSYEQINEIIARSPEEIEMFNQMDKEAFERDGGAARLEEFKRQKPGLADYSKFNYRLIQDWEVPEWIKVQPETKEDVDPENLGKRARKTIINMDNLTDLQFEKAIEDGKDL